MGSKFLITYTLCSNNKEAREKMDILLKQCGFTEQQDQSTYLGGNGISQDKLNNELLVIKTYLKPQEEHITVYFADGDMIKQVK